MTPCDTLLTNARLPDGRTGMALALAAGRIAAILPPGAPQPPAGATHDLGGQLVLPGLTDGHLHLDKTLLGLPWMPHEAGPTRASRIATDQRVMPNLPLPPAARAFALIRRCVAQGTALIRTHAGVWSRLLYALAHPAAPPGLRSLEYWLCRAARRAMRLLRMRGLILARRLGLHTALPMWPWMMPNVDLSETLMRYSGEVAARVLEHRPRPGLLTLIGRLLVTVGGRPVWSKHFAPECG